MTKYQISFASTPIGDVSRLPARLAAIGLSPTSVEGQYTYAGTGTPPTGEYVSAIAAEYGGSAAIVDDDAGDDDASGDPNAAGKA